MVGLKSRNDFFLPKREVVISPAFDSQRNVLRLCAGRNECGAQQCQSQCLPCQKLLPLDWLVEPRQGGAQVIFGFAKKSLGRVGGQPFGDQNGGFDAAICGFECVACRGLTDSGNP